jgi:N-acyl amino acid synthase of PEP-CTERM/exosortase system
MLIKATIASERSAGKHPRQLAPLENIEESLLDRFNIYFRTALAVRADALAEALRIRYQVYCLENSFENPADHQGGLERDAFDAHSVHSLLIHRASAQAMGTARLVMPVQHDLEQSFPIQSVCTHPQLNRLPLGRTAEVSRFCISKQFRRRQCDTVEGVGSHEGCDRRQERRSMAPLMSLGLIQSLVRMSEERGITHWCATMEPTLLRLLAAMSIHFEPLGPLVRYHGTRQPCYLEVGPMLERVKNEQRQLWDVLTGSEVCGYSERTLAA